MSNRSVPIWYRPQNMPTLTASLPAGKCAADTNPDAWFPEPTTTGRPSRKKRLAIALEAKRAIDICNTCPVKDECLKLGMDSVNLPYGIWGGKLPHERIKATGKTFARWSEEGQTLHYMQGLQPYLDEVGIGSND